MADKKVIQWHEEFDDLFCDLEIGHYREIKKFITELIKKEIAKITYVLLQRSH